ncbi:MAG: hypothetical protein ACTSVI_07280 [Promethearchaeota archaeon]
MFLLGLEINDSEWQGIDDLLDLMGTVKVQIGDVQMPAKYFPDGIKVRLYETVFEMLQLLETILDDLKGKSTAGKKRYYKAEFCYSSTFLSAMIDDEKKLKLKMEYNPALISDEDLLHLDKFHGPIFIDEFAFEILDFSIRVVEAILNFNEKFEDYLLTLEETILKLQERLEKEFGLKPDI